MLNNSDILQIAMEQSAYDLNCNSTDFLSIKNKVVASKLNQNARKYLTLPFYCNLVSYGSNIIASVNKEIEDIVKEYIDNYPVERCFETPNLHILNDELQKSDMRICFMAEYFLPDVNSLRELPCEYELRVLKKTRF